MTRRPPTPTLAADAWQPTRAETQLVTQILPAREDDPAAGARQVGHHTGGNVHELFVSCAADLALQQQFEHLQPVYIALHDIGTHSSKKLLAGLASASARAVQTLVIRRQGYGNVLARVEFVELPGTGNAALRLYATEVDADTSTRAGLARALLAFSRLGVVMVGELPAHAVEAALQPLREAITTGPWPNRQLLLLPLASGTTLASVGAELGRGSPVDVRCSPQVSRLSDAWEFIQTSWGRVIDPDAHPTGASAEPVATPPRRAGAALASPRQGGRTGALPMRAMPPAREPSPPPRPQDSGRSALRVPKAPLQRYVEQVGQITGVTSCCVFEVASGLELAHAGGQPDAADLAMHGKALLAGMAASARSLGMGASLPEAAITLETHHLVLRPVPGLTTLALHVALDKALGNLTLARLQLQRLDPLFAATAGP